MFRIALHGYGAMGQAIEHLAIGHGCTIVACCHEHNPISTLPLGTADAIVDFSVADAVPTAVQAAATLGIPIVVGTTGWYNRLDEMRAIASTAGVGMVYGTNFSIGVHMFFRLVEAAATMVNTQADYDVMLHEWHHANKRDSPSGTALTAAGRLLAHIERKRFMKTEPYNTTPDASTLHVTSTRGGHIAGRHQLTIDGPFDRIDIIHDARSRDGFASGALQAARWIVGRTDVVDVSDVAADILGLHP
jgi:4-hydroxy-tetrahydrodipicolinate reductase